jgi:hypothetical protein
MFSNNLLTITTFITDQEKYGPKEIKALTFIRTRIGDHLSSGLINIIIHPSFCREGKERVRLR